MLNILNAQKLNICTTQSSTYAQGGYQHVLKSFFSTFYFYMMAIGIKYFFGELKTIQEHRPNIIF